ncbi:MAG TPA: hypothetical protein VNM92_16795 [Thermoanaerobaculia bacterium]|nr:hypothetical protein [Thermoanaerobaculia bacterium]
MNKTIEHLQTERELVLAIVHVLPHAAEARVTQDHDDVIAIELPSIDGAMLRTAVFSRAAVVELLSDPSRAVKVEYLQRDILAAARARREFRYPRTVRALPSAHVAGTAQKSEKKATRQRSSTVSA